MENRNRFLAGALGRILVEGVIAFYFAIMLAGCSQVVNLQTGLQDADANEIVALLNRYGIEAKKVQMKDGITLSVKDSEIARATELMRSAGLPKRRAPSLGDIFKKEGMISTPLEERVRYIYGLSQELEATLMTFDNVISARVHVVLPERVAPGEPIQPSSASVFVKYREPFDADSNVFRIRSLVAGSIPGLSNSEDRSKVSIVFAPAAPAPQQLSWDMVGPFRVESQSASSLRTTLAILLLLAGYVVLTVSIPILMKFPKAEAVIRKLLPKQVLSFVGAGG